MIELQDEIEGECVNSTELWVRSNRRNPPNQTLRLRPHFRSLSPSLSATRRLRTPPPHLRRALRWILHRQNLSGTLSIPPRTNRRSAKREREKKKRLRRRALECSGVWRNGREKKGGKKDKKEKSKGTCVEEKKRGKKKEKRRRKCYHNIFTILSQ